VIPPAALRHLPITEIAAEEKAEQQARKNKEKAQKRAARIPQLELKPLRKLQRY
jgi:hypothetical protein